MDQCLYYTSQFAHKASISVRTLRYYDKIGLLVPSCHTHAGFRQYTDGDLLSLQRILALKFLGFSLEEIKICLQITPSALRKSLAFQRAMMQEKREQLDLAIKAISEAEHLIGTHDEPDWTSIIHVIQVIQMQQSNEWRKGYFTDEQLQQMDTLSKQSYTEEDRQKLAEYAKNFTEADQQRVSQQWSELSAELNHLVSYGADPASPEAQALTERWLGLINQFTHGDSGITQGLKNFWNNANTLPESPSRIAMPYSKEGGEFINRAIEIYRQRADGK